MNITLTKKQLAEIIKQATADEPKPFPQKGDDQWTYDITGHIRYLDKAYTDNTLDTHTRKGVVNVYRSVDDTEKARDIAFAKARLKHAMDVLNNGWVPDWSDHKTTKYTFALFQDHIEWSSSRHHKTAPDWMHVKSTDHFNYLVSKYRKDIKLILSE